MGIFEKATRQKLRFDFRGVLTTEDLWDLSTNNLDVIYQGLMSKKETSSKVTLKKEIKETTEQKELDLKIEIVTHIFNLRTEEQDIAKTKALKAAKIKELKTLASEKANEELRGKSTEEINKLIAELETEEDS